MLRLLTRLTLIACLTAACGGRASTDPKGTSTTTGDGTGTGTSTGTPDPAESETAFRRAAEPLIEDFCEATTECYEDYGEDYSVGECTEYVDYSLSYFDLSDDGCRSALFSLLECFTDNFACDSDVPYYACERETNRLDRLGCTYYDYDYDYGDDSGPVPGGYYPAPGGNSAVGGGGAPGSR